MEQINLKDLQPNQYCLMVSSQGEGLYVYQYVSDNKIDKRGLELYNLIAEGTEYHHYQYNDNEQSTCLLLTQREALSILTIQGL